ncbi:Ger(x)C family spore germination protein [Petroclostridium sp. X23]|uniref:Ger(x)C family spore germination protein n=1 Tax=Petroclostridium sp. X23 TaxID=3045146 RepID=UPI0024ACD12A|nr:Ger(x)C family spore germination protein [Petroclostridium sp. X23]WHH57827.1 Ger(x)C family spore germination protein [Petroclostridium sp. X23]
MVKLQGCLILFILVIGMTGCKSPIRGGGDIQNLFFVTVFGVDKLDNGLIRISVSSKKTEVGGSEQSSQSKQIDVLSIEGRTLFEAIRNLRLFADRKPIFGHTEFVIISEQAAKDNIADYIDLFTRDHEQRLNSKVLIIKGSTAEEVLNNAGTTQRFVSDRMENLLNTQAGLGISSKVELSELIKVMDNQYLSAYLPYIQLEKRVKREQEDKNAMDIVIKGFAIFKGSKLIGYISDGQSRGLNWIKNNIESTVIVVTETSGNNILLELIDSKCKILPKITNNMLSVTIKIMFSTNIGEVQGRKNVFTEDMITYLNSQQQELVKNEIKSVIDYAQKNNTDILEVSNAVFHKYPVQWDNIKDQWGELFSELEIDVEAESKINRTYEIQEKIKTSKGEE